MRSRYEVGEVIGPKAASGFTIKKFTMQSIIEEIYAKLYDKIGVTVSNRDVSMEWRALC